MIFSSETLHKTRDRRRKAGKQWDTTEPVQTKDLPRPAHCLQLCPDFFYCFLFLSQYQAWVWCFPPPPTMLTPEPTTGSVPSSCDTGLSQGGWAELGITLLPSLVHLSAYPSPRPEPTLLFPAHTNVHAGKAPWQRGQRVASSVPNPLLYTLAFSFPPQKSLLHFAWGELARELLLVPPPIAPGSVPVLAPTCTKSDSGRCQLNGSAAARFFSYVWKNYFKNGKKVKEAGKTNKQSWCPQGPQAKNKAVRKRERDARMGQVYMILPHVHSHLHLAQETMAVSVPGWAHQPLPAEQLAKCTGSNLRACLRWAYIKITLSAFLVDRRKLCDLHMSELELPGKPWSSLKLWPLKTGAPLRRQRSS